MDPDQLQSVFKTCPATVPPNNPTTFTDQSQCFAFFLKEYSSLFFWNSIYLKGRRREGEKGFPSRQDGPHQYQQQGALCRFPLCPQTDEQGAESNVGLHPRCSVTTVSSPDLRTFGINFPTFEHLSFLYTHTHTLSSIRSYSFFLPTLILRS